MSNRISQHGQELTEDGQPTQMDPQRAARRRENRESYERTYQFMSDHRPALRRIAAGNATPEDADLVKTMARLVLWELRRQDHINLSWG